MPVGLGDQTVLQLEARTHAAESTRGARGPSMARTGAVRRAYDHAQLAEPRAAGGRRERPQQASACSRSSCPVMASSALTSSCRRPDLEQPRGAGCGRHELRDEPLPAAHGERQGQLLRRGPAAWRARAAGPRPGASAGAAGSSRGPVRSRRPGVTAPRATCDAATSAGSRSSSVVVVTNACGSAADAAHQVRAAVRVQLGEHVVEEQQRRAAVDRREHVQLRELERQDRGPLLAARGEPREVATVELEGEVVAMRPDERGPVPQLLLRGLRQAASQRRLRRPPRAPARRW